ncbi:hypothetical protein EJ08DRAFT_664397 [Tothia fuscella]|uniref:Uncharacterized protein n=1 Tax=Tothia fuscella TaxID=1048955 RepID=A0A9P4TUR8_9PEZI|nr:hypothetical protein EJ08DRAFT_664397 [Tothia fuscella]
MAPRSQRYRDAIRQRENSPEFVADDADNKEFKPCLEPDDESEDDTEADNEPALEEEVHEITSHGRILDRIYGTEEEKVLGCQKNPGGLLLGYEYRSAGDKTCYDCELRPWLLALMNSIAWRRLGLLQWSDEDIVPWLGFRSDGLMAPCSYVGGNQYEIQSG